MEDEKGLDLSLGLPCGGNNSSHKSKQGSSSDVKLDEGDRGSKLINEFKNFLEGGNQPQVGETFGYNFSKPSADLETSKNSNTDGLWLRSDNRPTEIDEKTSGAGEKRKNRFTETNQQKKYDRDTSQPDLADKGKTSHISITTDEGSTADNEDVADSEVDGSTSRHVSQHDDVPKRFASTGGVSMVQKDSHGSGDSSGVEILGQKRFTISSEKEFNAMNMSMSYGAALPVPPANIQPAKDSNSSGTPNPSNYPKPSMMHSMATTNIERPGGHSVMPANFPLMYGYPPVQLPVLDRDNSRGIVSHHQQINPTYSGRNPVNQDTQNDGRKLTQVNSHKSSETTQSDVRAVEAGKSYGKQQVGEEGSSSHTDGDLKGNHVIHQLKDASNQPRAESLPSEFPAIRPGITADLKFGGCGSYPNLPWVSTNGSGPNGRTISGVTYKYSPTQIKIVCACHGSHMSPDEFIQHANEENNSADAGTGLPSLSGSNPAASAQT
ncbi:ninja-family protein mc410-like [Salvia splendens]|uniref:ninja-family protein mc410-like n=1 Tax=Salvia splendens TaxID=180675 RepID=UPI0011008788|nr:ninja-family protein mc410-like [Salvia splendens]XP_042042294.1 ninja-family protein mc410-like [Salvia splendens]XP_042042295.1 ninja-family protein mc410-like [Salvia splendens]